MIHIIIPHFGSSVLLSETLVSFLKQEYREKKVVVIDNDPDNPLDNEFKKPFPEVNFIRALENGGWACACNKAVREINPAAEDLILLTNNDVILPDKMILSAMTEKYFAEEGKECIAGASVFYKDAPEKIHNRGWILFENKKADFNKNRTLYSGVHEAEKTDYVSGCFMMFPYSVFGKIGMLDKNYFMYAEDADFCYRAWLNDIPVFCDKSQKILHTVGGASGPQTAFREYYLSRNLYLFLKKFSHHSDIQFFEKMLQKRDGRRVFGMFFRGTDWKIRSAVLDGIRDGRKGIAGKVKEP